VEKNPIKVDPAVIAAKLSDMLKESGWHNVLKGFLVSEDFSKILTTLNDMVNNGERFTPPLKQVFNAFQQCPMEHLKVVIVGQDPYPQLGVADGISFSCSNTKKPEASLKYIFRAINDTVYDSKMDSTKMDPDLSRWSNQGVLMLNTALTTEINKIGKHYEMWHPFTSYLIDMLNSKKEPMIWVFMGKKAQELKELIDDHHVVLECSHPSSAAYQRESNWNCNDIFNAVNTKLKELGYPTIIW
jgi:uracil-DNA glycosylase